ncbi:hypothetical protein ACFL1H_04010 [Nanoarchaeota archaeon]
MINRKDFRKIKANMDKYDVQREKVIRESRDVIKLSKKIIYSIHRNDLKNAKLLMPDIKKKIMQLQNKVTKYPKLDGGSFKVAVQEYVETICYYEYLKSKKIPTSSDLGVKEDYYLMGLCDLTGELVRLAINSAIAGNFEGAIEIKQFVTDLYEELMLFDFVGELRKKFDSIKYDLKKLDSLVLDLKLKK